MSVTPDLIAVALGRATSPSDAEWDQWSLWISDALLLIEARLGDPNELDQDKLDYVVREAVVAQVQRPDDATQVAISVDDGSVSKTYRSSTGRVAIRDEWWDLLDPNAGAESGKAFSIDTAPSGSVHLPWCSLSMGANYCSCGVDIAGYPIYELGGYP